ncbi:VOC family protein [Nitratireductor basaltis]|uniref:Glyoxalase/bleomycin resistance protein/dioxygenase n=1 Tax=Nitratireductor basaltis TaxID=472175 RepID=A0A084UBE9_9HYPH|nr:VOC family protein [Nitratireductor basaltis]KFB10285.1 Glyoxalase/bleomycin resistance protein/dioxygenase [Nitratireductor basaltis]
MTRKSFAATTPLHIGEVGLNARDANALADFYKNLLGLTETETQAGEIRLGVAGTTLLVIRDTPDALRDDAREAGLFHTAFLLPERRDLARWLQFALSQGLRLEGASDHLVSEAVYLSDPEGNGIEIYVDRPAEDWPRKGQEIDMKTLPLDVDALMATLSADDAGWSGAPEGTVIGHIHLRVGDPARAGQWWNEVVGLETMARYGSQAEFLASGGYHHHVGVNNWRSAGAGPRDRKRAGLSYVLFTGEGAGEARSIHDPWGTEIRFA